MKLSTALLEKYEFHNFGHALEILTQALPSQWEEIQNCLAQISITVDDIQQSGGNKSPIPKKFDEYLFPRGWSEIKITGDLTVRMYNRNNIHRSGAFTETDPITIDNYIDGHNIDFVKGKVAFDLEWNSKDQTFDRDLLAMRTYFDCGLIDVGIIVTRSEELNDIFRQLNIMPKYGASTTWIGKLIPRLKSRRNGGCPILAIGMKKMCVEGWHE